MSVRLMTLVYEARFYDVQFEHIVKSKKGELQKKTIKVQAPSLKSVCLALADHANDEGEGAYPSITKLEVKTELSRPTVISCLKALKSEGVTSYMGISKLGTCNYTLNKETLTEMTKREGQKREKKGSKPSLPSKSSLPLLVNPVSEDGKPSLLKPSFNHPQPSVGASAPPPNWGVGWQVAADVEEVQLPSEDELSRARLSNAVNLFAPIYQKFVRAFILATDIYPISKDVANWQLAFKDQINRTGLAEEDITDACKLMRKDNLTIKDPHSIMNKIADIRAQRKAKQQKNSAATVPYNGALDNFNPAPRPSRESLGLQPAAWERQA